VISALTGNTALQTFRLRDNLKETGPDVNKDGKLDECDSYLLLETEKGQENVDLKDIRQALQAVAPDGKPVSAAILLEQLKAQYSDPGLLGFGLVNGSFCFDMLSTYRHQQSFALKGDEVEYTLQFDPNAPVETYNAESANGLSLVKDKDGVLHWEFPAAPEPPPVAEGAVTEATAIRRDGLIRWLFPGEVPQPGDQIIGNTDTFAENIVKESK
jgi:hypothetical protein